MAHMSTHAITNTTNAQDTQPSDGNDLLTLAEVRQYCRIGKTTLWRWMNQHGLRVIQIEGFKRVKRRDLNTFLDRHQKDWPATGSVA